MDTNGWTRVPAPFALPLGASLLLAVGATAAELDGRFPAFAVAATCGVIVAAVAAVADLMTAPALAAIGWLTATAFGKAPYAELHPATKEAAVAAVVMTAAAVVGICLGRAFRPATSTRRGATLEGVTRLGGLASAVDRRRRLAAYGL